MLADDISAFIIADTEVDIQLLDEFFDYYFSASLCMNPEKSKLILFRKGGRLRLSMLEVKRKRRKSSFLVSLLIKTTTSGSMEV